MSTFNPAVRSARGRHRLPTRGGLQRLAKAITCSSVAALAVAGGVAAANPAQAATTSVLGAAGQIDALSRSINAPLARHTYSHFNQSVPAARMITVTANANWRTIASAGPGSAIYSDIVRWAQTIKARKSPVLLAFHHEPEAAGSSRLGSPADFIAAHRHVVSIFRGQGATNVKWVWQMTAYAFRAKPGDHRYAATWYPGDAYVDVVGADGYAWGNCFGHRDPWVSLASIAGPVVSWARAHGKQASLPEWGAASDPRRAQWLADAHQYMAANKSVLSSSFYFNRGDSRGSGSCTWQLNKQPEFSAFGSMARDSSFSS